MTPDMMNSNSRARVVSPDEMRAYVLTHIDDAIDNGWIRPYYQPVIRTLTGKLCGFEALARWDDPTYGLLSPAVFIPVLEETRLIHLLDCSIIKQVCRDFNVYKRRDGAVVPVSLNLSRLDFDLCDMFSYVEKTTYEYGVPRRMLNIEITESALADDPEYMSTMMRKFQQAGYQVWMDDFGSGYSTLNVLKDFDFDELKIDMGFLSNFGEKSKTILATVVDMSKKLGIQTLAEGVETEEHRDYLRSIGCEKMQGYLFGKPAPFDPDLPFDSFLGYGIEPTAEQRYVNEIGAVNPLSMTERDFVAGSSTESYVTSMPLATIEYSDGLFKIIEPNMAFRDALAQLGVQSVEEAEAHVNDTKRAFARQARQIVDNMEDGGFARYDYMTGDVACVMRARHISSWDGRKAIILSFGDTIGQSDRQRHDRMSDLSSVMYSIYDHVDIIHLDEQFIEPVFGNIGLHAHMQSPDFSETTRYFANAEVFVEDRERYCEFMDHATMIDRIVESGEDYLAGFFRLRGHGGDYTWKLFFLLHLKDKPGNQVMLCIRGTHWNSDDLLQAAFDSSRNDDEESANSKRHEITDGSLWRALMQNKGIRLFWKDINRRFVGANRAFLDFYGFDSVDDIIGKTDEDMGWHINPAPFQKDELSVLHEGLFIEKAHGQCIVHGEMRDIVASKHPVYRNGRIVGLMGFFADAEEVRSSDADVDSLPLRDEATGVLNYTGLEAATWKYVDTYKRHGIDFAMISINVDNFETVNKAFGNAFGEKVLKRVADELVRIAGHKRVIGHVFANRFVVLAQGDSDEELQALCDEIERSVGSIARIDGTPCTVYALAGYARFSQHGNVEAMKRHNRDMRLRRRDEWSGSSKEEDIITSSLI